MIGFYWSKGRIKEMGEYKAGVKNGLWCFYNEFGYMVEKGYYVDGNKEGVWREFDGFNHKIKEGVCQKGYRVGRWVSWYFSGEIRQEEEYGNGNDGRVLGVCWKKTKWSLSGEFHTRYLDFRVVAIPSG